MVVGIIGYVTKFRNIDLQKTTTLTVLLSFLSMAGIFACVILLDLGEDSATTRFMINIFYLTITLVAIFVDLNWGSFLKWQKLFFMLVVTLFVTSGLSGISRALSEPLTQLNTGNLGDEINFLRSNGLTYGYGPYHGSDANAVTALSKGSVIIRPVVFNRSNGMMTSSLRAQSSPSWYSQRDFSPSQRLFFIYIINDGEECNSIVLCTSGLTTQFGPPIKTLYFQKARILVWDHSLLGYPYSVSGNYWRDGQWGWMGKSLTIVSRQPMQIQLRGTPYAGTITNVIFTINGKTEKFALSDNEIKSLYIPASSVANISAGPTFSAYKVIHKKRTREYALQISLPQPAP